jgi:hypothetical protein
MFVSRTSPRRLAGLTRSRICLASRPPPLPPSPLARVANPNIPFAHSGLKKSALLSSRDSDVATLRARPQIVAPTRSHQIASNRHRNGERRACFPLCPASKSQSPPRTTMVCQASRYHIYNRTSRSGLIYELYGPWQAN